ncbi:zf-DHHC-domain-containing protein [Pluteus cervinus]|uniref:Zf-DHHC-domain-containing protein n=1 Tax=Pluteus cervinus TaxID=181527 RepID=A0ACD3B2U2_9AGAR|nr:zf-DHHC-domain-containing protein [Pluteus cervinus]
MYCSKTVFRCFRRIERFGDRVTGAAGRYFVIIAAVLIGLGTFTFFDVITPSLSYPWVTIPICVLIAFNLHMHYFWVCTVPPGFLDVPPQQPGSNFFWAKPRNSSRRSGIRGKPLTQGVQWSSSTQEIVITRAAVMRCRKCGETKPERTHHCRICNRCVLKYDHHCPMLDLGINQCVGIYNERHFVMFMIYLVLATSCFTALGYPFMLQTLGLVDDNWDYYSPQALYMLMYILSPVLGLCVFAMLLYHLSSIASGESSVEAHDHEVYKKLAKQRGEEFVNSYDVGRWKNFEYFFNIGPNGYPWTTLIFPYRIMPYTDGRSWARKPGYEVHGGVRNGEELTDEDFDDEDD